MSADMRARFLNQRVMTATPGQRVVMLYDRLHLDLTRATEAAQVPGLASIASQPGADPAIPAVQLASESPARAGALAAAEYIDHAMQIVAELAGSLDRSIGGPADNLAAIYGFLLRELAAARGGAPEHLAALDQIVATLRAAWSEAVAAPTTDAPATPARHSGRLAAAPLAAVGGPWVG